MDVKDKISRNQIHTTNFNTMSSSNSDPDWQPHQAIPTVISILFATLTSLAVLSFPKLFYPKSSLALVLSTLCLSWHFSDGFPDVFAQEQWLRALIMFGAHMSHLLVVRGTHQDLHTQPKEAKRTACYRGYKLLFNFRGIGTDWEVPYLHRTVTVQQKKYDDPTQNARKHDQIGRLRTKSRWSAVRRRVFYLLVNYLVLCLYYELLHPALYLLPKASDFTPTKESFLRRLPLTLVYPGSSAAIAARELWVRICMVVELVIPEYFWLASYHDISAIIFIGIGLDGDEDWPPIMGSVSAATTLRGFWGCFWHRILYRSFSEHATVLARWLGFRKGTTSGRLASNVLVFAFSAFMHAAVSFRIGNKCAWGRSMWFWVLQPVGFIGEGVVQTYWRRLRSTWNLNERMTRYTTVLENAVGCSWVCLWFFWSEPKRIFPLAYCGKG
ncbi:hypothetical protein BDV96DRAFT_566193 [Lophiotrema nucula]|uniref:Wax synthase domain-containing protein n=1 Tax=Lophiotrema nucula TaxID=690887 RepID=A0A6A5ZN04_9PLEO|nr:hypothetical protein BDV96DRAFT_566193 [Lophiotrema nucula]